MRIFCEANYYEVVVFHCDVNGTVAVVVAVLRLGNKSVDSTHTVAVRLLAAHGSTVLVVVLARAHLLENYRKTRVTT